MAGAGKTAFVIGGSGGLGQAACLALARDWDHVVVGHNRSVEKAEAVAAQIGASASVARCDLRDCDALNSAIAQASEAHGGIGTMVFAGGVAIAQPFVSRIEDADWREVIETELIGFTRVVAATLPLFRRLGGGNFVSVVSVANYCFPPGDALSSVPKAGIEALGRAIAKEEGRYGIRANMVAPGIIDAGLGAAFQQSLYTPEIWESQRAKIPMRRFGADADIAEAVAFLASDKADYVTGQTLIVDGGFSL